jgi:hypothetical protein
LELFLAPLQFVYLFCNLSKCILLFFSCTSSLYHPTLENSGQNVPAFMSSNLCSGWDWTFILPCWVFIFSSCFEKKKYLGEGEHSILKKIKQRSWNRAYKCSTFPSCLDR